MKKRILTFECSYLRVVAPIDPLEGHRNVDPVNSEGLGECLEHIYRITYARDDYVNPMTGGKMSWWSISSLTSYSSEALENWQDQMHEISMRKCARITCYVRRVGIEASELHACACLLILASFLTKFEEKVTEH